MNQYKTNMKEDFMHMVQIFMSQRITLLSFSNYTYISNVDIKFL